jgi:uncharacterized protein (TIGR04222 family)
MKPQQTLYDRISAYSLDDIDSALPFSQRLAKEQGWTLAYAHRAIEEYKRFVFLAIASGHPVSPSEAVDQVWHLHLTYTQNYWNDFCPNLLGRAFHHHPTLGGPQEAKKHQQWYQNTLNSYSAIFHQQPPLDIWSPTHQRFGSDLHKPHFNPQTHWLLPKPQQLWANLKTSTLRQRGLKAGALGAIALTITGCSSVSPLDLTGGEFLWFYILTSLLGFGLATIARSIATQAPKPMSLELNTYDMAYLAGGSERVNAVALMTLIEQDHLKIEGTAVNQAFSVASNAHPIEKALWNLAQSGLKVEQVRTLHLAEVTQIRDRLEQEGLLGSCITSPLALWLSRILPILLLVLGGIKICLGLLRGRPVIFLIILVIFVLLFTLVLWSFAPRSRHGNTALGLLQTKHKLTPTLSIAVALSGMAILASSADPTLAALAVTFAPPPSSSGDSGGSSGDSGSSCGGGGCGGGCGGCGG